MKLKKLLALLIVALMAVSFVACGGKTNNTEETQTSEPKITVEEFKAELKNLGIEGTEEETMYELVGATAGFKFTADDKTLELYTFDKDSNAYKNAKKDGKLTMESLGSEITENVTVANGYAIILPTDFPQYDAVLALFNRLQ
ncbi:hypothetical protein [Anaerofustis sp. NSJ-163]|uniref:hypothetical protein n=1 Tax=Anaerofustis sp. NSJ-163 TaxID=2944391 RepID=UPI00209C4DA6|nr:hypothetical protein [Anaerofustis sp. NSJ-163]MCO8193380.1 hypothetical protein [Anaerofustis sp. NSJ-163]